MAAAPVRPASKLCEYCHERRAIHRDHVVPRSLLRRFHGNVPAHLLELAFSCGLCNWRKQARRLIPESWAPRLAELTALFPGTPWRVWDGNPKSPAYSAVHV